MLRRLASGRGDADPVQPRRGHLPCERVVQPAELEDRKNKRLLSDSGALRLSTLPLCFSRALRALPGMFTMSLRADAAGGELSSHAPVSLCRSAGLELSGTIHLQTPITSKPRNSNT